MCIRDSLHIEILKQTLDLLDAEAQLTQLPYDEQLYHLLLAVIPIFALLVSEFWNHKSYLIVISQRLDGNAAHLGNFPYGILFYQHVDTSTLLQAAS